MFILSSILSCVFILSSLLTCVFILSVVLTCVFILSFLLTCVFILSSILTCVYTFVCSYLCVYTFVCSYLGVYTVVHSYLCVYTFVLLSCCLTSTEARWPIRDGDRVGRGRESERLDRGNRPKKTGETVDRRQNNGSVKAVSPRHCPATCALRNCSFNCCAGQSH